MISIQVDLGNLAATQRLGAVIAEHVRPGDRVLLIGEIGAGKTTLARTIGSALNADPPLASPTFLVISEHAGNLPIWHADAYRLPVGSDAIAAGLIDERHAAGVVLIEWPEQLDWPLQGEASNWLEIELALGGAEHERSATLRIGDPARGQELRKALSAAGFEDVDGS